ncbi:maleylacetoacetate isomerase [Phyllobacterium sp. SYP-B3895]|uniref:maleylacetoacetate isomerase n=1 Tax=Phyllobacterium sp. SYP-B3895 TaxID=2663240 RepID=UPI0012998D2C|nr:maleylacetoacetate isomerase [Phyllobacterium sp. SYP-B3895]MRG57736.1 maleylacetoacetate isomerase [Phyllobacterium sp. SYP-B3895]
MSAKAILYDYWRSSASYRVRIALNMAGLEYDRVPVDLLNQEHKGIDHLCRNPQGLVPTLAIDGHMMTQSLAIIEYLNESHPEARFLPDDPLGRQRVRALSYAIAMEIHPVCNLGVASHVMQLAGGDEAARRNWMRKFISEGLGAFETMLDHPETGHFCHGDTPTMADFCLVPQVFNARRWGAKIESLERVNAIAARCDAIGAFAAAHPDRLRPGLPG